RTALRITASSTSPPRNLVPKESKVSSVTESGQDEIVTLAAELAGEFATFAAELDRTGEPPRRNLDLARARGVLALTVPERFGGRGVDRVGFARYQERGGRGGGSTALVLAMH